MRKILPMLALLAGFSSNVAMANPAPQRVVSLDYCADQFLLKMLPRRHILALSPDAGKAFSYMHAAAAAANDIPQVRPLAENILSIHPDLVVRSYGGGPRITYLLQTAGVNVLQLPYANSLAEIRAATLSIATRLGVPERGAEMVAKMELRLQTIDSKEDRKHALYMTPTGATSGPGTLVHDMLLAAGFDNFEQQPGWRSLPLERLAYEQPDLVVAAFFDHSSVHTALWSSMRHPVAQQQLQTRPTVMLPGAWTSCGAWFLLDAIEALADSRTTADDL